MSNVGNPGPPDCEFDSDKLILQLDALVESRIETLSPVVDSLMHVLSKTCFPIEQEFAVETALREALANAILHGNRQDPKKKVRVCCACELARGVLIIVRDEGEGFDLAKIPNPIVGENIYLEHGRGIYLINLLMDEVQFARGGTEIRMRKSGSVGH